jgi:hypothetical protein
LVVSDTFSFVVVALIFFGLPLRRLVVSDTFSFVVVPLSVPNIFLFELDLGVNPAEVPPSATTWH